MKPTRPILMILCALWLLIGCSADKGQMLRQLEELEQMNRADSVMRNDSLAEDLVAYLDAAGCADTTAADCDYKTLSRIHAQSAIVYNQQIQPRSQLMELRQAEYYATRAKDTLMAIECYADMSGVYRLLDNPDSVILIEETVARMFLEINNRERYAQSLGGAITSLVKKGELVKAKNYIDIYERYSGLFDNEGNIVKGREIYYYAKGNFFLAIHNIDSAEYMFRKELRLGRNLNNQIAGCIGLQSVFKEKRISDSIAKYANLGYVLNDSAYSLSEMQNIQKMQASYNYNHKLLYAEQESNRANRIMLILVIFAILVIIGILLTIYFITEYKKKKTKVSFNIAIILNNWRRLRQN